MKSSCLLVHVSIFYFPDCFLISTLRFETWVGKDYTGYMEFLNVSETNNVDLKVVTEEYEQESAGNSSHEVLEINQPIEGEI